jgi:hypothetical protein
MTSLQHWKQHVPLFRRSNAVPEKQSCRHVPKKPATAQQAEAVVDALMKVFDQPLFDWERPRVVVDTREQGRTVVVWERGPHGWTSVFPCGGMLNGTLWEIPKAELPKGVWVEPYDGCAVGVYQEVAERQSTEIRASSASSAWVPWTSAWQSTAGLSGARNRPSPRLNS